MASDIEAPTRVEPIFDEFGQFTIRYAEFFDKTGVSVNESSDEIDQIELDLTVINSRLDAIEADIVIIKADIVLVKARLDYLEGLTIVTALDLTIDNAVTGHQTIICTAAVTIKLDATPNDRDTAEIKQKGFQVVMDGNGKNIEGNATLKLRKRNTKLKTGLVVRYSSAADEWYAI